jgi:hypothetical protein
LREVRKFKFKLVSTEKVRKKMKDLRNKKSMRWDDISYFMIKVPGDDLAEPLMRITNGSTVINHHKPSTKNDQTSA